MKESGEIIVCLREMASVLTSVTSFIKGMTYDEFRQDDKTLFALAHAITLIGAAAQKIPLSIREQYPNIPWREMTRMPAKLAYGATSINQMVLWQTARADLPALALALDAMRTRVENAAR